MIIITSYQRIHVFYYFLEEHVLPSLWFVPFSVVRNVTNYYYLIRTVNCKLSFFEHKNYNICDEYYYAVVL